MTPDKSRHTRCLGLGVKADAVEVESDHHRTEGHGELSCRVAEAPDSGPPAAAAGQQPRTASQPQCRGENLVVVVVIGPVALTAAAGCVDILLAAAVPEHGEAWRHTARTSVRAEVLAILRTEPALRMIVASSVVVLASHKLLAADTACASDERTSAANEGIEKRYVEDRHLCCVPTDDAEYTAATRKAPNLRQEGKRTHQVHPSAMHRLAQQWTHIIRTTAY